MTRPAFEGVQLQIYPNLGALFIRRNEVTVSSSMSKSPGCRPKLARYAEILRSYLAQNDMPGLGGNLGYYMIGYLILEPLFFWECLVYANTI